MKGTRDARGLGERANAAETGGAVRVRKPGVRFPGLAHLRGDTALDHRVALPAVPPHGFHLAVVWGLFRHGGRELRRHRGALGLRHPDQPRARAAGGGGGGPARGACRLRVVAGNLPRQVGAERGDRLAAGDADPGDRDRAVLLPVEKPALVLRAPAAALLPGVGRMDGPRPRVAAHCRRRRHPARVMAPPLADGKEAAGDSRWSASVGAVGPGDHFVLLLHHLGRWAHRTHYRGACSARAIRYRQCQ